MGEGAALSLPPQSVDCGHTGRAGGIGDGPGGTGQRGGGPRSLEWEDLDPQRFFLLNPLVFFGLRVLQHPAAVIKTRYQASGDGRALREVVRSTLAREGVRGLYRGFSTSCALLIVQQAYIVMYERLRARDTFAGSRALSEPMRNGLAAAAAVFVVQTVANPVDVIVQRKMLQGQLLAAPDAGERVLSAREIARDVLQTRGLRGFFSGFFISCAQFVPSASLWWYAYPIFVARLHALVAAAAPVVSTAPEAEERELPSQSQPSAAFCRAAEVASGSLASALVAVALNPVDLVRTRTQVEGSASLAVLRRVLAEGGLRGLWKGVLPRIAMLVPQGALSVSAYELVKRLSTKERPLA